MDDASLSEHEQRILDEIERNLVAEDSDFVRRVREATPRRDTLRMLRLSILGLVVGLGLLLGYTSNIALGIAGFLVMLASVVGVGTSIRHLRGHGGRAPGDYLRDVWRRTNSKINERRRKPS